MLLINAPHNSVHVEIKTILLFRNERTVTAHIVILNIRNLRKLWQEIHELFILKCAS